MYTIYYDSRLQAEVRKKPIMTLYNNITLGLPKKIEVSTVFLDATLALKINIYAWKVYECLINKI